MSWMSSRWLSVAELSSLPLCWGDDSGKSLRPKEEKNRPFSKRWAANKNSVNKPCHTITKHSRAINHLELQIWNACTCSHLPECSCRNCTSYSFPPMCIPLLRNPEPNPTQFSNTDAAMSKQHVLHPAMQGQLRMLPQGKRDLFPYHGAELMLESWWGLDPQCECCMWGTQVEVTTLLGSLD